MNTTYQALDNAIDQLRASTYELHNSMKELKNALVENGMVTLERFKGKRSNHVEAVEIEIGNYYYVILFDAIWLGEEFEVEILAVERCNKLTGNEYAPIYQFTRFTFDEIKNQARNYAYENKDSLSPYYIGTKKSIVVTQYKAK